MHSRGASSTTAGHSIGRDDAIPAEVRLRLFIRSHFTCIPGAKFDYGWSVLGRDDAIPCRSSTTTVHSFTFPMHSRRKFDYTGRSFPDHDEAFPAQSSTTAGQSFAVMMQFQQKFDYDCSLVHLSDAFPAQSCIARKFDYGGSIVHGNDGFPANVVNHTADESSL